mmetsp:Transcript_18917/g.24813  ORF Transcript_18917/g.24813 Transcript_18917/m.24813 type:complete len:308 (+) Transcript_18917:71-994(+)
MYLFRLLVVLVASIGIRLNLVWGFLPKYHFLDRTTNPFTFCAFAQKKGNDGSGYKFGDLSKGLAKKAAGSINKLTGQDEYKFGDLSRWLDKNAKEKVQDITGKDNYEFGDLSRWADASIKDKMSNFTNKEEYQLFDVSKEILRRAASGEYKLDDMMLLFKVLVSFGVGLNPIASALPAHFMLEMLNYSIGQEVGGRVLEAVSVSVDQRFKEALTGDSQYKLGDVTKREMMKFIGKEDGEYEFGDITKTVAKQLEEKKKDGTNMKEFGVADTTTLTLDADLFAELKEWDNDRQKRLDTSGFSEVDFKK